MLFGVLSTLIYRHGMLRIPGMVCGAFLIGYGAFRSLGELFRMPDAHIGFLSGGLTMGIILSLPMCVAGIVIILAAKRGLTGATQTRRL